jgi:mannan endo-1,4-beta-mannosidase
MKVTWMWTISHDGTAPVQRYWPGASYVNWIGIDGYFVKPTDTYNNVFGSAADEVRTFTDRPILLSEVGVGPGTGKKPQDITAVFSGIAQQHLLGSVWFDVDQHGSVTAQEMSSMTIDRPVRALPVAASL